MAVHHEIIIFQNEDIDLLQTEVNNWLHDIAVLDIVSIQTLIYPIYTVVINYKHNE